MCPSIEFKTWFNSKLDMCKTLNNRSVSTDCFDFYPPFENPILFSPFLNYSRFRKPIHLYNILFFDVTSTVDTDKCNPP